MRDIFQRPFAREHPARRLAKIPHGGDMAAALDSAGKMVLDVARFTPSATGPA